MNSGVDPGEYIPSIILQRGGWSIVIIPQYCEKLTIFCLIFTNIQTKSTDFALEMADF